MHTSALRFLMCAVSRSDGDTVIDLRDPWRPPCGPLGFLALGPRANRAGERDLPPRWPSQRSDWRRSRRYPDIDATDIGVAVKSGVVTLTGFVRSYLQKCEAERAAKRVSGVLGLANDIEVRLPSESQRTDPELAREAVAAIKTELPYAHENVKVLVKTGWATLEGSVEWDFRTPPAKAALRAHGTIARLRS